MIWGYHNFRKHPDVWKEVTWPIFIWGFPKIGGWNPNKPMGFFLLKMKYAFGVWNGGIYHHLRKHPNLYFEMFCCFFSSPLGPKTTPKHHPEGYRIATGDPPKKQNIKAQEVWDYWMSCQGMCCFSCVVFWNVWTWDPAWWQLNWVFFIFHPENCGNDPIWLICFKGVETTNKFLVCFSRLNLIGRFLFYLNHLPRTLLTQPASSVVAARRSSALIRHENVMLGSWNFRNILLMVQKIRR